jgi:outer membrane protein assembly factor BamB
LFSVPSARADEARAKAILGKLGVERGICLLVDEAGTLPEALAKQSELTLLVQLRDAKAVDALRRTLDAAGLLGRRVYVQQGDGRRLNLANDLADGVIAPAGANVEEVLRVLRPQGRGFIGEKAVTKGFRAGTDDWPHPYHAADNNPQSADTTLKRPFMTHFMAEPWYCPLPMQSVISGGRIFKVFGDRSSARPQEPLINKLLAMSAFNGTILWQRDLSPGFMIHRNTFLATPDTVYLGDDKSCKLIDAATGKIRDEIVVPADKSDGPVWKWMALEDGVLYALVGEKEAPDEPLRGERIRGAGWPWWKIKDYRFGNGKNLLAIDPKTKNILWHHRETETIDSRGMAMRKGRIYLHAEGKFVACLDAKTGTVLWRNADRDLLEALGTTKGAQHWLLGFASTAYLKASDDALYFAGPNRPLLVAASAKDGKLLWTKDCSVNVAGTKFPTEGGNVLLVLRPEGLYALGQASTNKDMTSYKLDPLTGKVLAQFPGRDRCTRATGCVDSIFTRGGKGGSTAVFDVTSQEPRMGTLSPMRPACQDGVVGAHGYLFWGPWMCRCDMTQLGVISLGSAGDFDYVAKAADAERLQRGVPAMAMGRDEDDYWPAYRKDNARSVATEATTPASVQQLWMYQPSAAALPTAPIAAHHQILFGAQDGVLRALDPKTGTLRWSAYTGGPLKYPPAYSKHRLFAGSADGYVYCLEPSTGRMYWRFRAAPVERTIPVYGTLSSTWPVCGVLVEKDLVYAAAGISNFDGTHVFALDAASGQIRWQQHSASYVDDELPMGGVSVQGPMILHQGAVHMASGNTPPIASYALSDGKYTPSNASRGKDLFIRHGQVLGAGYPLYWRPEDDQFLSTMELECPAGVLQVGTPGNDPNAPAKLALYPKNKPGEQPKELWANHKLFQEIAAVAFTNNAVVVTGLNRDRADYKKVAAEIVAVSLADGKPMWRAPLPGVPTAWGLALDREGRMIVTIMDGRVVAFR